MEKNELMMKALRKVQYFQQLYAGYHDLCVEVSSYATGLIIEVILWVRKDDKTYVLDGEHILHYKWQLDENKDIESLRAEFQRMSKFLSNPKNF